MSDKFPNFHLNIFALDNFARSYLGIFIQRVNPRAKALEPNQNKNAQIQLVGLSKQGVFVKLRNLSDKELGLVILPSTISPYCQVVYIK
jgi:hypothetical protein